MTCGRTGSGRAKWCGGHGAHGRAGPGGGTAPSFTRLRAPPPLEDWRGAPRGFSVQPAGPLSMWRVSGRGPERSRAAGGRQARPHVAVG
jgi:hypothetical protein